MYKALIVLLALLIVLLVLAGNKKISQLDLSLLIIGIVTITWKSFSQMSLLNAESFVDGSNMLNNEEDISSIQDNLLLYYTVFNTKSYSKGSMYWKSIVNSRQLGKDLRLASAPIFERAKGVSLGTNQITGPLSSRMNINFNSPYTLAFVFRHGNLQGATTSTTQPPTTTAMNKISMLKMFANSPNNNGIELFIERDTLKTENNVQFGKMMFQYANYEPIRCKLSPSDDFISIVDNTLCFVYIVRSDSAVRVMYSTATDGALREVAKFNIPNNDITFSNKELVINQSQNWNASLYNLAVYGGASTDGAMSTFLTHIKGLYTKVSDPNYGVMMKQYNKTLSKLSSMQRCTMNKSVCRKCRDIKEWNNITQILNAPKECTSAIADYCKSNPSHKMCECWDESSAVYSSKGCITLRGTLSNDKSACLANLSKKEIKELLEKHNVGKGSKGSKDSKGDHKKHRKNDLVFNNDYNFDMVRVKYDESPSALPKQFQVQGVQGVQAGQAAPQDNSISGALLRFFGY